MTRTIERLEPAGELIADNQSPVGALIQEDSRKPRLGTEEIGSGVIGGRFRRKLAWVIGIGSWFRLRTHLKW